MTSEGELDHNAVIRNILANIQAGEGGNTSGTTDCVAQLLAAAVAQFGNNTTAISSTDTDSSGTRHPLVDPENEEHNLAFNPKDTIDHEEVELRDSGVETTVEVPTSVKRKPLCIKFPIELRKRIIAMRKEGKKCMEVAKELHISVSGAQKVWERFLATGMVHDRKPSTYAGRPKKYIQQQDKSNTILSVGGSVEDYESEATGETQHEFMKASSSSNIEPSDSEPPLIVTCTGNADVFIEGALDVPGATVEIVESDPHPSVSQASKKPQGRAPAYRHELLTKLVKDCPLAMLREDLSLAANNPHIMNLTTSINKPLYMEYVLGHPFGKVPSPQPFDGSPEEAKIIISDPVSPIGKELLATLGYSTKVYFNACCKPSPLFDTAKVLSSLPFSLGPGYLAETMQTVLQLLLDLCIDPAAALKLIPSGNGLDLVARNAEGIIKIQKFSSPGKLSEYWNKLYYYASLLQCCENFLSATKPSAPCLLCHPFESVVKTLEIKDESISSELATPTHYEQLFSNREEKTNQKVEVQVLQSGQINFSSETNANLEDSTVKTPDIDSSVSASTMSKQAPPDNKQIETSLLDMYHPSTNSTLNHELSLQSALMDASTQTPSHSPVNEIAPLIIRRNRSERRNPSTSQITGERERKQIPARNNSSNSAITSGAGNQKQLRRSSRFSKKCVNNEKNSNPTRSSPRQKQNQSSPNFPPPAKRTRTLEPAAADPVSDCQKSNSLNNRHPMEWSVEEVIEFISTIPRCDHMEVFREHEVDGESLLSLNPEMMVKLMNLKAGPALRIHRKILALKKQYNISII